MKFILDKKKDKLLYVERDDGLLPVNELIKKSIDLGEEVTALQGLERERKLQKNIENCLIDAMY